MTETKRPCLLCTFFKDSFDDVQDHINTVKDRENEIDFDPKEDGLEINNSTHTRKVKIRMNFMIEVQKLHFCKSQRTILRTIKN